MPKFRFTQDEKITIWNRTGFEVEADSEEEAIRFLKEHRKEHICDLECASDKVTITRSEVMYDTAENLEPEENGGQATIEFYPDGEYSPEHCICTNQD